MGRFSKKFGQNGIEHAPFYLSMKDEGWSQKLESSELGVHVYLMDLFHG